MKNVFITGGDKGIGRAIAEVLAVSAEHVFITYCQNKNGADDLMQKHQNIIAYQCNLLDVHAIEKVADGIESEFGFVDVLVNNAGMEDNATLMNMTSDQWNHVIGVDMNSLFYVTKCFLPNMLEKRWGRIINISSILGYTGVYGGVNYATAKAGVVGFTKSLAKELGAKGITVNAIAPGIIDTDLLKRMPEKYRNKLLDMIPSHQVGSVNDVAYLAEFLASDKANYINGQTIHVNGGMYGL